MNVWALIDPGSKWCVNLWLDLGFFLGGGVDGWEHISLHVVPPLHKYQKSENWRYYQDVSQSSSARHVKKKNCLFMVACSGILVWECRFASLFNCHSSGGLVMWGKVRLDFQTVYTLSINILQSYMQTLHYLTASLSGPWPWFVRLQIQLQFLPSNHNYLNCFQNAVSLVILRGCDICIFLCSSIDAKMP